MTMDYLFKALIISWALLVVGLAQEITDKEIEDAKDSILRDDVNVTPKVLSKDLTFLHKYNDTERNDAQTTFSKFTLPGGLANKIQNLGGVQKTVLNNKIQYNFYFWLLPKDFNATLWKLGKTSN